jgi:4-hydroxyphenylpyruvate dioxygenase-like putative hemolysin
VQQNIQRIDHFIWLVKIESFDKCVAQLNAFLGIHLEVHDRPSRGVRVAIDWDAGIEVVAPTDPESYYGKRLAERGEGMHALNFGVNDLDEAIERAERAGFKLAHVNDPLADESPFGEKFKVIREAFFDPADVFGVTVRLGQIEPK